MDRLTRNAALLSCREFLRSVIRRVPQDHQTYLFS